MAALVLVPALGALLIAGPAWAQVQPAPRVGAQAPAVPATPGRVPSSTRWDSLPQMSVDRCLAESIGTATDPKTGAPSRAVDPDTGRPVCPPAPNGDASPPRGDGSR